MRSSTLAALSLCTGLLLAPALTPAPAAAQKAAVVQTEKTDETPIFKGRLPNYYGQVGISEEQRQNVYRIQSEYEERIEKLLDELEELRADRDAEVAGVLTDEQQAEVDRLRKAARDRRAARRRGDA